MTRRPAALLLCLALAVTTGCASLPTWLGGDGPSATEQAKTAEEKRLDKIQTWRKTIDGGRLACSAAEIVGDAALASGAIDTAERRNVQVGVQVARRGLRVANQALSDFLNATIDAAAVEAQMARAQTAVSRVEATTQDLKTRESLADPGKAVE